MILDVDPKVDYAFKHLFGREEKRPILVHVLDSVLNPAPGHHIQDVDFTLRHAEKMDTDALPAVLRQPIFLRAVEELKMLAQNELERERYESRRKAQMDYNSGLKEARLEGKQIGLEQGKQIGAIQLCERLLHRTETPAGHLASLSLEELIRLAEGLQEELAKGH